MAYKPGPVFVLQDRPGLRFAGRHSTEEAYISRNATSKLAKYFLEARAVAAEAC